MFKLRKPHDDWLSVIVSLVCVGATLIAGILISDYITHTGLFYYKDQQYEANRAKEPYCKSGDKVAISKKNSTDNGQNDDDKEARENYNSCQQWRSAQAAERAAFYTSQQALVAWLSLAGTVIAVFIATAAAKFAYDAASHTEKAAKSASDQAQAAIDANSRASHDNRPWLTFTAQPAKDPTDTSQVKPMQIPDENQRGIPIHITTENLGKSPARSVKIGVFYVETNNFDLEKIGKDLETDVIRQPAKFDAIFPGHTASIDNMIFGSRVVRSHATPPVDINWLTMKIIIIIICYDFGAQRGVAAEAFDVEVGNRMGYGFEWSMRRLLGSGWTYYR